jgi:hypothetical protein
MSTNKTTNKRIRQSEPQEQDEEEYEEEETIDEEEEEETPVTFYKPEQQFNETNLAQFKTKDFSKCSKLLLGDIFKCCKNYDIINPTQKKFIHNGCTHYSDKPTLINFITAHHNNIIKLILPFFKITEETKKSSNSQPKKVQKTTKNSFEKELKKVNLLHKTPDDSSTLALFINQSNELKFVGKGIYKETIGDKSTIIIQELEIDFSEEYEIEDEYYWDSEMLCLFDDYAPTPLTVKDIKSKKINSSIAAFASHIDDNLKSELDKYRLQVKELREENRELRSMNAELKSALEENQSSMKKSSGFRGTFAKKELQDLILNLVGDAEAIKNMIQNDKVGYTVVWNKGSVFIEEKDLPLFKTKRIRQAVSELLRLIVERFEALDTTKKYKMPNDTTNYDPPREKLSDAWIKDFIVCIRENILHAVNDSDETLRERVAFSIKEFNAKK